MWVIVTPFSTNFQISFTSCELQEFFKKTKCIKNEVVVTFGLLVGHEKLAKNCDKTNVFFDVITRDVVTDFQTSFH